MKKALKMLIPVLVLALVFSFSASAFSGINSDEQRVLDFINAHKQVQIGRSTYELKDEYITHAYNVLNRDTVDLTKEEADTLIAQMQELLDLLAQFDVDGAKYLTDGNKQTIAKEMQDCADVVNLEVVLDLAQNKLSIMDPVTAAVVSDTIVTVDLENNNPIQTTGSAADYAVVIGIAAALALVGCAFVLNKKRVND